ncbi:MAG: HEAT repeat domain-containing protein [Planctomycetota bacterium]
MTVKATDFILGKFDMAMRVGTLGCGWTIVRTLLSLLWITVFILNTEVTAQSPAELRDWELDQLVEQVSSSDLQTRRDAVYELVRRRSYSKAVIDCLAELADERDEQLQFQALMGLARAGDQALPAADALIEVLNDRSDQMRYRAAEALGNMGPGVLPMLMEQWADAGNNRKVGLCNAFGRLGADATDAKSLLVESLAKEGADVVASIVDALSKMDPGDADLWCNLACHQENVVRFVAIRSLAAVESPDEEVRQCLEKAVDDTEPRVREQALISIARSNVPLELKITVLLRAMRDPEYSVRSAAIAGVKIESAIHDSVLEQLPEALAECEIIERADSYLQLIESLDNREPGKDVVESTVKAILDRSVALKLPAEPTAEAIAGLGVGGVRAAIQELSENELVEPYVSLAIARAGNDAERLLLDAIENDAVVIRVAAVRAAGALEPTSQELLMPLISRLEDPEPTVRLAVVESLGLVAGTRLASDAASTIQEINGKLVEALNDDDASVRAAIIRQVTVAKMSPEQETLLIDTGLEDDAVEANVAALACLMQLQSVLQRRADRVLELLDAEESEVRALSFRAIGGLTGKSKRAEAIARLADGLSDASSAVRVAATESLQELNASEKNLVDLMAANLGDDLDLLRVSLAGLESAGEAAADHAGTVRNLLKHPTVDIRVSAVSALAAIANDPLNLANSLTEALEDSEWTVRRAACEELGEIGETAKVSVPKLFAMIDVEEDESIATGALREIGAAPATVLPQLMSAYESENFRKRLYAVFLTGKIGEPAKEALPRLEEMLEEANRSRRSGTTKKFILQAIDSINEDSEK